MEFSTLTGSTEAGIQPVTEPVTELVTEPVTDSDQTCSECVLRKHLTSLIDNQSFSGLHRQMTYRSTDETGQLLSSLFNDKTIGLIGQWGSTSWGATSHMLYRHDDGKCYGFYMTHSDLPTWVFPIDQEFVDNY